MFTFFRLKTQLEIIYRRADFRNMSGTVSLLQFSLTATYRIVFWDFQTPVVTTIHMTTTEAERWFSTLKGIRLNET